MEDEAIISRPGLGHRIGSQPVDTSGPSAPNGEALRVIPLPRVAVHAIRALDHPRPRGVSDRVVEWPVSQLPDNIKRALRAGLRANDSGEAEPALTDRDWRRVAARVVVTVARIREMMPEGSPEPEITQALLGVVRAVERALRQN